MVLGILAGFSDVSASIFSSCRGHSVNTESLTECELVPDLDIQEDAIGHKNDCVGRTAKPFFVQHAAGRSFDTSSDVSTAGSESEEAVSEVTLSASISDFSTVDSGNEGSTGSSESQAADSARSTLNSPGRARRFGVHFQESLALLGSDFRSGWVWDHVREGLECSFRVVDGTVHVITIAEFPGCDPLLAFAAFCEADLCMAYKPNVVNADLLGEVGACDSLWLMQQTGKFSGRPEDTIVEISTMDALDEPAGSLWVCISSPNLEDLSENWCTSIPPVQKGVQRIGSGCTTCWITPLKGPSQKTRGFRIVTEMTAPAPAAVSKMPTFALRMLIRKGAQEFASGFQKHITIGGVLDQHIQSSARAEFYARVRMRL